MTPLQLAEMAVSLAEKAASGPWRRCEASDGKCQCGLVWALPADAVVCEATHKDSSGHCGEGFNFDTMLANGDLIAFAGTHLATLARAVIEAEAERVRTLDALGITGIHMETPSWYIAAMKRNHAFEIENAVKAERERCANVADEVARMAVYDAPLGLITETEEIAQKIASALRQRTESEAE